MIGVHPPFFSVSKANIKIQCAVLLALLTNVALGSPWAGAQFASLLVVR